MSEELIFTVGATKTAPVQGIGQVRPKSVTNFASCEKNINVGVFFDGTGNNRDIDRGDYKHSNIVRLWDSYSDEVMQGYFRVYVPGVGTPCNDLREKGSSLLGNGFATGSEARVLYGLLMLYNAIHRAAFNGALLISMSQITALCCNNKDPSGYVDTTEIMKLGLKRGLLASGESEEIERQKILASLAASLQFLLSKSKIKIKECFLDVFGFSRGAAQARVFCSWLSSLLIGGKLAGVVIHIRFLGIMDTVASAGFWASTTDSGHGGWANPVYLRIPSTVRNCVHMVAMHELRKNFPLDSVTVNGKMPANCREFAYPGAHSDVGGGYVPGALGVSVGKDILQSDALKLSQITLGHMFDCAVAAGVPLNKERGNAGKGKYDQFAVAPSLQAAFLQFLDLATVKARPVREWLQPYLNWRWDRRLTYASLGHVRSASGSDRALLMQYNNYLLEDIALLERAEKRMASKGITSFVNLLGSASFEGQKDHVKLTTMDLDALPILQLARKTPSTECMRFNTMFDGFVHDSLAGFDIHSVELSGHLRYRKGFLGSGKVRVADIDDVELAAHTA